MVEVNGERFVVEGNWSDSAPTRHFEGTATREATGEKKAIAGPFLQIMMKDRLWHERAFFEKLIEGSFFAGE